jgi:DNA repair exonuclease SbcCD nuclease subunit
MTRVIHTGDTHIGYQQYHSSERRQDFLDAFEQVIDDAIEMDVAAVIHAGDLFHDRRPELPDLLGTLSALRRLAEAEIPFLAVVGNHESTRGGQWLDLFERMDLATRLGPKPVPVDDIGIYGLDHVPVSRRDDLDYEFTPPSDETSHSILVSHGLFTPFAHANWETETVLETANVDFDALLLGDNHAAGTEQVAETWVTYCGSTERASASERDGRGYNVIEFGEDSGTAGVDIRQRSLSTRPFVFVSVELAPGEGSSRVREQVRQHDLSDAVVSVEILGEGEPVTPASIEEFALDRGALVSRVTDRREIETEAELSVSFADPDAAVDEKIRELGLSTTALGIDETVRASKIADSNVRDQVSQLVDNQLDDQLGGDATNKAVDDDPVDNQFEDSQRADGADPETPTESNAASESATENQLSLEDL